MLLPLQRGGAKDRDLLAVLHSLESRPHRDLCLAVANITADVAIHWYRQLHVGLYFVDRAKLVTGFRHTETQL